MTEIHCRIIEHEHGNGHGAAQEPEDTAKEQEPEDTAEEQETEDTAEEEAGERETDSQEHPHRWRQGHHSGHQE